MFTKEVTWFTYVESGAKINQLIAAEAAKGWTVKPGTVALSDKYFFCVLEKQEVPVASILDTLKF